jgi:MerR family mercuric resistance operon transcriptional regulator
MRRHDPTHARLNDRPRVPAHTIGHLARSAGVPVSTVRYYERAGLLRPDARTGGNYRSYSPASLARLRFIKAAQATGFSLKDVRELLGLTTSDASPCEEVETVTRNRLAEVRQKIRELRHVEGVLLKSLDACCKGESLDLCNEIGRLGGRTDVCKPADRKIAKTRLTLH